MPVIRLPFPGNPKPYTPLQAGPGSKLTVQRRDFRLQPPQDGELSVG